MKNQKQIKSMTNKLMNIKLHRHLEKLDFRMLLNRKINVDHDRGSDGVGSDSGTLREVYNDYIIIVNYGKEKYIPINRIILPINRIIFVESSRR